jgi:hypothetical protein
VVGILEGPVFFKGDHRVGQINPPGYVFDLCLGLSDDNGINDRGIPQNGICGHISGNAVLGIAQMEAYE